MGMEISRAGVEDVTFALTSLVRDGTVSAVRVNALISNAREIARIEAKLHSLRGEDGKRSTPRAPASAPTLSPRMRAARKLQGRYLGALKRLGNTSNAGRRLKAIARAEGVAAAVRASIKLKTGNG